MVKYSCYHLSLRYQDAVCDPRTCIFLSSLLHMNNKGCDLGTCKVQISGYVCQVRSSSNIKVAWVSRGAAGVEFILNLTTLGAILKWRPQNFQDFWHFEISAWDSGRVPRSRSSQFRKWIGNVSETMRWVILSRCGTDSI